MSHEFRMHVLNTTCYTGGSATQTTCVIYPGGDPDHELPIEYSLLIIGTLRASRKGPWTCYYFVLQGNSFTAAFDDSCCSRGDEKKICHCI